jgi:hypothetical protein
LVREFQRTLKLEDTHRTLLVTVLVALLVGAQIQRETPHRDRLGHNGTETDKIIKRAIEAKLRAIVLFHKSRLSRERVLITLILEIALNIPLSTQVSNSMLESLDNVWKSPAGCAGLAGSLVVKPGQ